MSQDPRQYLNDNEEAARLAQDGHQANIWTAMPAIVQSVDLAKMTCVCQLAIQGRFEDDAGAVTFVNIALLHDVPIVFPQAGGFAVTFPIAAGDEVLIVFASRCIDSWWQNGGYNNKPMEFRMHDLSDGYAIPGPKSQPNVIGSISATDLQMRNAAGTVYLSIGADGKIGFKNATGSLKTLITQMNTALIAYATTMSSVTNIAQINAASATLLTALNAVTPNIGALLK